MKSAASQGPVVAKVLTNAAGQVISVESLLAHQKQQGTFIILKNTQLFHLLKNLKKQFKQNIKLIFRNNTESFQFQRWSAEYNTSHRHFQTQCGDTICSGLSKQYSYADVAT